MLIMKKILVLSSIIASFSLFSCSPKFEVENTATESLAGNWICSIFHLDTLDVVMPLDSIVWARDSAEYVTYNTSDNVSNQMWINDYENFWGTLCKIDCNAGSQTFGVKDSIYTDEYYGVGQKIWGGKVTYGAAKAPASKVTTDKIEFYIQFEDDDTEYGTTYYVVGYRRTGFPEDDGVFVWDWNLPEQK